MRGKTFNMCVYNMHGKILNKHAWKDLQHAWISKIAILAIATDDRTKT
jgi:hypothetical protein